MASSLLAARIVAALVATLVTTAALAEDMSLPGPSGDCLTRATAQFNAEYAKCTGMDPLAKELRALCISNAQVAYIAAMNFCYNTSGAKLGALRVNEARNLKAGTLNRR